MREIIENFAKISRKSTILKFRKAQNNFVKISCFAKFWNCCFAATLPTTSCKRVYTVHVMFKIEWIFRTQWVLVIGQLVSGHENSLFHVAKTYKYVATLCPPPDKIKDEAGQRRLLKTNFHTQISLRQFYNVFGWHFPLQNLRQGRIFSLIKQKLNLKKNFIYFLYPR